MSDEVGGKWLGSFQQRLGAPALLLKHMRVGAVSCLFDDKMGENKRRKSPDPTE